MTPFHFIHFTHTPSHEKKPALETHKDHNLFPGKEIETVGQDCHFGIREMK
jgi:hypothetical protein